MGGGGGGGGGGRLEQKVEEKHPAPPTRLKSEFVKTAYL